MRRAHAEVLCCPRCAGDLELEGTEPEVLEGRLACRGCSDTFPVEGGVPRLLVTREGVREASDARSRASFGYEWLRYPVTTSEEDLVTLVGLTGVEPTFYEKVRFGNLFTLVPGPDDVAHASTRFFAGKNVYEAGCGMGKYVNVVSGLGARLAVGLDASESVRRAAELVRARPNALIVQGDLFRPPLKPVFDFAYSVGVLHHTPAAKVAFERTVGLVRERGAAAVWLYPHGTKPHELAHEWLHEKLLRPLTSRLPLGVLERACGVLGSLAALKTRLKERGGAPSRAAAAILNVVAVGEHRDPAIAAFLNFDWYSPRYRSRHTDAELARWFAEAGFGRVRALPVPVSGIGFRDHAVPSAPRSA